MSKSSREQIREDEFKVIEAIKKNSKESIDNIAKKCGFSRQKVWRIIKRLEKTKMVWGYSAVVDNEKLEMKDYLVLIKKANVPMGNIANTIVEREIEDKAKKIGVDINSSYYLHGEYDWQINISAESIVGAKKFCEVLNKTYTPNIREIKLLEIIFPVKECGIQNPNVKQLKDFL